MAEGAANSGARMEPTLADRFWSLSSRPVAEDRDPAVVVATFLSAIDSFVGRSPDGMLTDEGLSLLQWLRRQEVVGDLTYASPEQARGEPVDERSLVFSVGVLLFERLTGRHPFGAEGPSQRLSRVRRAELASAVNYFPKIPAELRAVVVKAIAAFPEERWNNLSDLCRQLQGFVHLASMPEARRAMRVRSLPAIPDAHETMVPSPGAPLAGDSQLARLFEPVVTSEFTLERSLIVAPRRAVPPILWMVAGAAIAGALAFVLTRGDDPKPPALAVVEHPAPPAEPALAPAPPPLPPPTPATPVAAAVPETPASDAPSPVEELAPAADAAASFDVELGGEYALARAATCFTAGRDGPFYFGATLLYDDAIGESIKVYLGGTRGMTAGERACLSRGLRGLRAGAAPTKDTLVSYQMTIGANVASVKARLP